MASAESAIAAAESKLRIAYFGLEDMVKRPDRFHSGLMNAVVFARMVTFALQSMAKEVPEFNAWYELQQAEMRNDPSMNFFKDLRNKIEKTSAEPVYLSARGSFSSADIDQFRPVPPGADRQADRRMNGAGMKYARYVSGKMTDRTSTMLATFEAVLMGRCRSRRHNSISSSGVLLIRRRAGTFGHPRTLSIENTGIPFWPIFDS